MLNEGDGGNDDDDDNDDNSSGDKRNENRTMNKLLRKDQII